MDEVEVAIIGCGPAGLSSAIFCGRANLKVIVIGLPEKSQAQMANHIENYFGFPEGIDGSMLLSKGMVQAQKFNANIVREEAVSATAVDEGGKNLFVVKTSKCQNFRSKAMIIATGVPIRLSGIANEDNLTGKGVHYCVNCDGAFYKGKKLAIIGSGDHAAEAALEALSYTKDVVIISNAPKFEFSDSSDKELTKFEIKTMLGRVKEFKGGKWLSSVLMEDGSEQKFDGVFMACGAAGAIDFAANLGLELKDGLLVVDEKSMTSMPGVFAAGNCEGRCRQIAKNVGDGCNAAINVIKYLRDRELYFDYAHNSQAPQSTVARQADAQNNAQSTQPVFPIPLRKMRIGWFSFSCCEDSTIVFTELLNDNYDKWKNVMDIRHARILRRESDISNLDVAFVEGAIATEKAEEELKKIRQNSKKLVAVGACAITGMPSGQRNTFDASRKREIEPLVRAFDMEKNVKTVKEVVPVDDTVPGCPMIESAFIALVGKYAKEFGLDAQL